MKWTFQKPSAFYIFVWWKPPFQDKIVAVATLSNIPMLMRAVCFPFKAWKCLNQSYLSPGYWKQSMISSTFLLYFAMLLQSDQIRSRKSIEVSGKQGLQIQEWAGFETNQEPWQLVICTPKEQELASMYEQHSWDWIGMVLAFRVAGMGSPEHKSG